MLGVPLERLHYAARRKRRRAWVAAGSGLLVAAGALLILRAPWLGEDAGRRGTEADDYATLLSGRLSSGTMEILPGSRFSEASILHSSADEPAVIRGSSGYIARLGPGGELALGGASQGPEATTQELRLMRGEVKLSVPRLPEGSTLSVRTEDARVIVRGTEFTVSVRDRNGAARTCVQVAEGAVEVQRQGVNGELLKPGQESGCEEPLAAEANARQPRHGASPAGRRQAQPAAVSTLEKETALFASALAAEQAGDLTRARRELSSLLRRYPQSPVANEARAALDRVTRAQAE